jgi:predicted metal-dependent phosphoesterase TrpH
MPPPRHTRASSKQRAVTPVADLHLHTIASDGRWPPAKVVRAMAELGFSALAIADHDEVSGIAEAIEAGRECGVEIVPAVELSTAVPPEQLTRADPRAAPGDREVHILGYYIDREAPELHKVLEACRTHRHRRMHTMVKKLGELGVPVDIEHVQRLAGDGAIGRPHLAQALVDAGHVESIGQAFTRYLSPGRPAHAPKWKMTPAEACALIRRIGGVPVLAHPMLLKDDSLIKALVEDGVLGLEAYYSNCPVETSERYARMADDAGLLVTGGSDCHQTPDAILMGRVRLPYERVEALRARWKALGAQ